MTHRMGRGMGGRRGVAVAAPELDVSSWGLSQCGALEAEKVRRGDRASRRRGSIPAVPLRLGGSERAHSGAFGAPDSEGGEGRAPDVCHVKHGRL